VQAHDDFGGFGLLGSLGVDATTLEVLYQRENTGVLTPSGVIVAPDVAYSYALLFNFQTNKYTAYFEGRALVTNSLVDLGLAGANLERLTDADIVALQAQADGASHALTGTAYFDNFRIYSGSSSDLFLPDGNGDGIVSGLDLAPWKTNFGARLGPGGGGATPSASAAAEGPAPPPSQSVAIAVNSLTFASVDAGIVALAQRMAPSEAAMHSTRARRDASSPLMNLSTRDRSNRQSVAEPAADIADRWSLATVDALDRAAEDEDGPPLGIGHLDEALTDLFGR
jgi:hypothetical protein